VHNYIILGGIVSVIGFVLLQSLLFGQGEADEETVTNLFPLLMTVWGLYLASWFLYIYMEEQGKKLEFMQHYRKSKEFQKLQGILSILMPSFVR